MSPDELKRRADGAFSDDFDGIPWEEAPAMLGQGSRARLPTTMQSLEDLMRAARRLPPEDRRRMLEDLEASLRDDEPPEDDRRAALERFIARSGSLHSEHTDVSSDKYKHLAEVYATKE
jgi:hypothetical protein